MASLQGEVNGPEAEDGKAYCEHNLIVNYLPQSLTNEELSSLFSSIGPVKMAKIIRNKATGLSYGFGFVEYENEVDAAKAMTALNGVQLQNKRIKVAVARQGENIKGGNLYVRYLPKSFFANDLEELFGPYGRIVQARVLMDNITGLSRGIGFVLFGTRDEATLAKEALDGKAPPGQTQALSVKFAEDNKTPRAVPGVSPPGIYRPFMPTMPGVTHVSGQMQQHVLPGSLLGQNPSLGRSPLQFNNAYGAAAGGFGEDYQNSFSGGPVRSGAAASQRFNPMTFNPVAPPSVPTGSNGAAAPYPESAEGYALFVYNIGADTEERDLWKLFAPYGTIRKVNVVKDFDKKVGKGYGFVTMVNYQEALYAIQVLNGFVFKEKPLQVSLKHVKTANKV